MTLDWLLKNRKQSGCKLIDLNQSSTSTTTKSFRLRSFSQLFQLQILRLNFDSDVSVVTNRKAYSIFDLTVEVHTNSCPIPLMCGFLFERPKYFYSSSFFNYCSLIYLFKLPCASWKWFDLTFLYEHDFLFITRNNLQSIWCK